MKLHILFEIFFLSLFISYLISQPEIVFVAGEGKYVLDNTMQSVKRGNYYLLKAYIAGNVLAATMRPNDTSTWDPLRVFLQENGFSRFKFVNSGSSREIRLRSDIEITSSEPGSNNTLYLGMNSDRQLVMSSNQTSRFQFVPSPLNHRYKIVYQRGQCKEPLGIDTSNCLEINSESPVEFQVQPAPRSFKAQRERVSAARNGKSVLDNTMQSLQSGSDYLLKAYIAGNVLAATIQQANDSSTLRVFLEKNGFSCFKFVNSAGGEIQVKTGIQIISSDPWLNSTLYLGMNSDNQVVMSTNQTSRFQFVHLPRNHRYKIVYQRDKSKEPLGVHNMSNCLEINSGSPLEFQVQRAPMP